MIRAGGVDALVDGVQQLEAVLLAGVGIEYGEKRCDPTGLMIIVFEEDELRTGYIGRGRRRVDPLDDEDSFAGGGL